MPKRTPERASEGRRIIERATGENAGFADSLFSRAAGMVWPQPSPGEDAAELWGRRVARSLGVVVAILLIFDLLLRWSS